MKFPYFFIRQEEVVLDCFTHLAYAYDYAKIDWAMKYAPDWWKELPSKVPDSNPPLVTLKHCNAVIDYYKKGIVIPSWFEMNLMVNPIGSEKEWEWASSNTDVSTPTNHPGVQFPGFAGQHGHNIKLISPWAIKTKKDMSFTWTEPLWNMQDTHGVISVLPGLVNYKYTHATEINLFVKQTEQLQTCTILPLTPLAIMHPMTEKKVKIVQHLVTLPEYQRVFGIDKFVMRRDEYRDSTQMYNSKKRLHEKIEQQGQGCPFHQGKHNGK